MTTSWISNGKNFGCDFEYIHIYIYILLGIYPIWVNIYLGLARGQSFWHCCTMQRFSGKRLPRSLAETLRLPLPSQVSVDAKTCDWGGTPWTQRKWTVSLCVIWCTGHSNSSLRDRCEGYPFTFVYNIYPGDSETPKNRVSMESSGKSQLSFRHP